MTPLVSEFVGTMMLVLLGNGVERYLLLVKQSIGCLEIGPFRILLRQGLVWTTEHSTGNLLKTLGSQAVSKLTLTELILYPLVVIANFQERSPLRKKFVRLLGHSLVVQHD